MLATTSTHDIMLIVAVILFFVCAGVYALSEPKSIKGVLLAVALAVFAWSFLVTT